MNDKYLPAFPGEKQYDGMFLRDYFAAKAMQGMLSDTTLFDSDIEESVVAKVTAEAAYVFADAMLEARKAK